MKKILKIFCSSVAILFSLIITSSSFAAAPDCVLSPQVIDGNLPGAETTLKTVLWDYQNYAQYNASTDRYELCLKVIGPRIYVSSPITIYSKNLDKDLYIYGLKEQPGEEGIYLHDITGANNPLLLVKEYDAGKNVIIENLNIDNVEDGIQIIHSKASLNNPLIAGNGGGACVVFSNLEDAIITGGEIKNCKTGVLIQDSSNVLIGGMLPGDFVTKAVSIKDNETGVKVESSAPSTYLSNYNMWAYTSFSGNTVSPIEIVEGNEYLLSPELIKVNDKSITCEDDGTGKLIRKLKFTSMGQEGIITFYKTATMNASQGAEYVNMCSLDLDGNCTLGDFLPPISIPDDECGAANTYIIPIFTGSNGSSTTFGSSSGYGNAIDLGDIVVFAGGVITQPTADPEGASAGGSTPGDSGTTEETGSQIIDEEAVTLADAPLGGALPLSAGCGASLIPYDMHNTIAPALGLWWIIFGIGLIASMRLGRSRISRRRRRRR